MKNNVRKSALIGSMICAFALGSAAPAINSFAATATGTASAMVIEPVSVTVIDPVSVGFGSIFEPATYADSLSKSGTLLRFGSNPPANTVTIIIDSGGGTSGGDKSGVGKSGGGTSSQPNNAKVVVTKNADGTVSISVTGKVGLTFSVMQPKGGAVTVEYN